MNCYSDLEKILKHFNCTFDDVVKEDFFTTNMPRFLEVAGYRTYIYKTLPYRLLAWSDRAGTSRISH